MKKKIICGITGHTGSIGKNLVKKSTFKFIFFKDDIKNFSSVERWIKKNKFDIIIHLAAIVPIKVVNENKKKAFDVNVLGTKNLVKAIVKINIILNGFFFHQHLMFILQQKKKLKKIVQ